MRRPGNGLFYKQILALSIGIIFFVDHQALLCLVNKPGLMGCITWWTLILMEFDFTIAVGKRTTHVLIDHMSKFLTMQSFYLSRRRFSKCTMILDWFIAKMGRGDFSLSCQWITQWDTPRLGKSKMVELGMETPINSSQHSCTKLCGQCDACYWSFSHYVNEPQRS